MIAYFVNVGEKNAAPFSKCNKNSEKYTYF